MRKQIKSNKFCTILFLFLFIHFHSYGQIIIEDSTHAVNIAMQNSSEIILQGISALTNMKISKFNIRDFLPSVNFTFSDNQSISQFSADNTSKSLTLAASQVIFDGGQRSLSYKISNMSNLYAYNEYEQAEKIFTTQILNQYYSVLKNVEIVRIKNDLLNVAKEQLVIVEREFQLGLITETNYLEFYISYLETENDKKVSERELERQIQAFKVLLGLDKNVEISFLESFAIDESYTTLIDYVDFLYERIKLENSELKKQNLEILATQTQLDYKKKWYLPVVNLEASLSFSGKNYPLTQPDYSVKLSFSFENNPIFPLEIKENVGIKNNKVVSTGNSMSSTFLPSTTFVMDEKQQEIFLLQSKLKNQQTRNQLYETLLDSIYEHDDSIYEIEMKTKMIALQKKKIEISNVELTNGSLKRVEYLELLVKLASSEIELLENLVNVGMIERDIEISTNIPFGELIYVCENQK